MTAVELAQLLMPLAFLLTYSILGWIVEVIYCAVTLGVVTNRGFLAGPYCPIYGFGGLGMVLLLRPVADNPALVFLGTMLVASALELVTGWAMEKLFRQRWWDYSDRPFNIGGYICLQFSLMWGLVGLILIDVLHPLVAAFLEWLNPWVLIGSVGALTVVVVVDSSATIQSALKFDRQLAALSDASELLRSSTDTISTELGERALQIKGRTDGLVERTTELKDRATSELKERTAQEVEELRSRREALVQQISGTTRRQLRAFPDLRSVRHPAQLEDLRARLARRGADGPAGKQ